jgi:hypothetical protein
MKKKKEYKQQIYGELFSPCFMTEKEYEDAYKNSIFYVEKDFMSEYRKHLVALPHVASVAKSYILNNWKKITNWDNLDVIIIHGPTGELTEYYNNEKNLPLLEEEEPSEAKKKFLSLVSKEKPKRNSIFERFQKKWDKENKLRHNPIKTIDSVVLDPTDGDFSITVNGKEHWWIQDEAIIIIADYIENQLKKTK